MAGVFLVQLVVTIVGKLVHDDLPELEPFLEFLGGLGEIARLVGPCRLVKELPRQHAVGRRFRLAPLFPVAVIHLVGPALGPVKLVFGHVLVVLGVHDVVEPDLVSHHLAVAQNFVVRHEDMVAEFVPLVPRM